jgi:protein TonB
VERFDQRQGFLISALVHLVVLMSLASRPDLGRRSDVEPSPETPVVTQRVFLPPPAAIRQMVPVPVRRPSAPRPRPQPTPPPATSKPKDRISIGPPSSERSKGPLILRREDDLTAVPKGVPSPSAPATPPPPPAASPAPTRTADAGDAREDRDRPGLRLPPGLGDLPSGTEGTRKAPAGPERGEPSIASSLRNLDQRLDEGALRGLPSGTGRQIAGLFFDPEGADFTLWINRFKDEVYRNWIPPQPALLGFRGHVDIVFTVERDGSISDLKLLKSAGQPALDRAAQNALLGSRFLPLPSDFAPPRVTIQVTFFYNEGPTGS